MSRRALVLIVSLIQGCTFARIQHIETPNVIAFTPPELLVEVASTASTADAASAAVVFESQLIGHLRESGFRCHARRGIGAISNAALLHVELIMQPTLETRVDLRNFNSQGAALLTRFDTAGVVRAASQRSTVEAIVDRLEYYYSAAGWDRLRT